MFDLFNLRGHGLPIRASDAGREQSTGRVAFASRFAG